MVAASPLTNPSFSSRPIRGMGHSIAAPRHRASDLLPSCLWVELLGITARQNLEWSMGVTLEVDRALRVLVAEPVRGDEIGHEDAVNFIAILVVLNRVADLTSPKDTLRILVGTVQPRIHRHLANFVSSADTNTCIVSFDGFHENFGDRQSLVCQVVVGERSRLVAVVQENYPPCASCRRLVGRNEGESRGVDALNRQQILIPLLAESGQIALNFGIGDVGRFIDDGNLRH